MVLIGGGKATFMRSRLMPLRAALGVATIALAGCTGTHGPPDQANYSTKTGATETRGADGTCGTNVPDTSQLLSMAAVGAPRGVTVSRSASVVSLDTEGCHDVGAGDIPSTACAPDAFPWPVSAVTQNEELYARGVERLAQATFDVGDKQATSEVILQGRPSSLLVTTYATHAKDCGGKVLATANGKPVLVSMGREGGLLLRFDAGGVITLRALGGRAPEELTTLMNVAS
jgi:hypothetical protein